MDTHQKNYLTAGKTLGDAKGALVMLHGRGATASGIISLADELNVSELAIYAPQANHNTWYPQSFLSPQEENQPALNSALEVISQVLADIHNAGFSNEKIYFIGFSQGACLTLEFVARNAGRYGGVVAFTGGLIGDSLNLQNYNGDFAGTPILITTGDPDPHVPLSRVEESVQQLQAQNGNVKLQIYKDRPHTITRNELSLANDWVFK